MHFYPLQFAYSNKRWGAIVGDRVGATGGTWGDAVEGRDGRGFSFALYIGGVIFNISFSVERGGSDTRGQAGLTSACSGVIFLSSILSS